MISLGLHDALRHVAPALSVDDYPRLSARYRAHYDRDALIPLFAGVTSCSGAKRARSQPGRRRQEPARARPGTGADGHCPSVHRDPLRRRGQPKPHPDMLLHLLERDRLCR